MPANQKKKIAASKFPLRLMSSVRRAAESFSAKEGVSLNQFINIAVAEKLAHLQHEQWLASRKKVTPELIAKALAILDRPTDYPTAAGDRLPQGYNSVRGKAKKKLEADDRRTHG